MALNEKSEDHQSYYNSSQGGNFMAIHSVVVEILHYKSNISTSWWWQMKSQGITKVVSFIIREPLLTFMEIYPIIVEIFQSGPNWWIDWQTAIGVPRATQQAWLTIVQTI